MHVEIRQIDAYSLIISSHLISSSTKDGTEKAKNVK